jgi:imidazolonepropionase-like amidohydrolase
MDNGPVVLAHVIFPTEEDIRIMKKHNAVAVHCPDATTNVIAGIMPLATLQDKGVDVCVGSDVGGGHHLAVYKQVARAVQLSKIKEFYEPQESRTINFANAFYCATKVGGSAFGKMGSLEPGYHFNAIVVDNVEDKGILLTPAERVELNKLKLRVDELEKAAAKLEKDVVKVDKEMVSTKDTIEDLEGRIAVVDERTGVRYRYINEVPEWARPTIKKLLNKKFLKGEDGNLALTYDLVRGFVVNDRAGDYNL